MDLLTVLYKGASAEPPQRYSTAADMADDLQRYLNGQAIKGRPPSWIYLTRKWCGRNPIAAFLVGVVILLVCVLSVAGPWVAYRQTRLAHRSQVASRIEPTASRSTIMGIGRGVSNPSRMR